MEDLEQGNMKNGKVGNMNNWETNGTLETLENGKIKHGKMEKMGKWKIGNVCFFL